MIGKEKKKTLIGDHGDDLTFANELNGFYGRFDTSDCNTEQNLTRQQLDPGREVIITVEEVCCIFKQIKIKKTAGSDRLTGRVLKECREPLISKSLISNLT